MILLALTGGMRREEIFGLTWRDIDLDGKIIHIRQAAVYVPGSGIIIKDTKTTNSTRTISVLPGVMTLLKRYKADQLADRLRLGGVAPEGKWIGSKNPEDDYVFTTWNGNVAHPHSINTWLKRFIIDKELPSISIHALRHMSASYLLMNGVDIRTVAGKLGHSKVSTTLDIYSHLIKSAEQETAVMMDSFLATTTENAKKAQKKQAK